MKQLNHEMNGIVELKGIVVVCKCGIEHVGVPGDAQIQNEGDDFDGIYWNCECRSTLFLPKSIFESRKKAA